MPLAAALAAATGVLLGDTDDNPACEAPVTAGTARIDITPTEPLRLSGYAARSEPAPAGEPGTLAVTALAIGDADPEAPAAVLIAIDAIGISAEAAHEIADRIGAESGLPRERIAVCATHTHCAPHLPGTIPFMFPDPMTDEQADAAGRYLESVIAAATEAAHDALAARAPARASWARGGVSFPINRRALNNGTWTGFGESPDAPVDRSVPIMRVTAPDGALKAVVATCACHCTTLGPDYNACHGDWAGKAREAIEKSNPEALALITIGCGADANPSPRGSADDASAHGGELAAEVERLLSDDAAWSPLPAVSRAEFASIDLPLDSPPQDEAHWDAVAAAAGGSERRFAEAMAARARDGGVAESVPLPVQTWAFGKCMAMVFLGGEVVVDHAFRLRKQIDADRLWISAYANALPSYIPSRRLLGEGGYEVDGSRIYYGIPARIAADAEDRIADEVVRQLPHAFYADETAALIPPPVEADEAVETIRVRPGLRVELAAAEPLTADPVDIAWGPDLRMWVVEMADYPDGIDPDGRPGGRVRILEDNDGDGTYDRSTVFLDGLHFPNSVLPWRDGALVVAAPDIIFARDTDGDDRADEQKVLFTGFAQWNPQHFVAGLQWGLDGWVHVAHGDASEGIRSVLTGERTDANGRDFRIQPDTGAVDPESGQSQYGRSRDDWGNWFGCDNSHPAWHFALEDRYLRRNPHVASPSPKSYLPSEPAAGRVFPASRTLSRFNDYDRADRFTSACGLIIYRDDILGAGYRGNYFVCEPVHNLVSRGIVEPAGVTFRGRRADDEQDREFFASTDNWCRPTSVRLGPDGALYVVDMYRLVIEHPEWIPADWQRKLRLRDGSERGRIYRIVPEAGETRTPQDLSHLDSAGLAAALDAANGWQRDMAHQLLLWREDGASAAPMIEEIARRAESAEVRVHALAALATLGQIDSPLLMAALADPHRSVRRQAIRLSEPLLDDQPKLAAAVVAAAGDPDPHVRFQAACALGEAPAADGSAGRALARILADADPDDRFLRAAVMTSAVPHLKSLAESVLATDAGRSVATLTGLIATAGGTGSHETIARILKSAAEETTTSQSADAVERYARLLAAAESKNWGLSDLEERAGALGAAAASAGRQVITLAGSAAASPAAPTSGRVASLPLLGRIEETRAKDMMVLSELLAPEVPQEVQLAAAQRLSEIGADDAAEQLLEAWASAGPTLRGAIIDILLDRPAGSAKLVERTEVARALSAAQRARLLHHQNGQVRRAAEKAFASLAESRAETMARYEESLALRGDAVRGKTEFAARCAVCHQPPEGGILIGPDLAALSSRSPSAILDAIIDPNRAVEEKFVLYQAETANGRAVAGIVTSESGSSVTLVSADGTEHAIPRAELRALRSAGVSMMPEGLDAGLDPAGMADLIAFVLSLADGGGIRSDSEGGIRLTAAFAVVSGPSAALDPASNAVSWIGPDDRVAWRIASLPAGRYAVFSEAAGLGPHSSEDSFALAVAETDDMARGSIEATGSLESFRQRKFGDLVVTAAASPATLTFRHAVPSPDVAIREIRLEPLGRE